MGILNNIAASTLRAHILEIRDRMRDCRERLLMDPDNEALRHEVDREIQVIQEACLHIDGHPYTIQSLPGFSCGECGFNTGGSHGPWDRIPMSKRERTVRRIRRVRWSVRSQCRTFSLAKRTYRIYHYYDYSTTAPAYVIGRGHPASIVAYLQFHAEREMAFDVEMTNEGAAQLLTRFYGYKETSPMDDYEDIDLYEVRESRCGRAWHNRIARFLYWRPGLSRELGSCVEEC